MSLDEPDPGKCEACEKEVYDRVRRGMGRTPLCYACALAYDQVMEKFDTAMTKAGCVRVV